MNYQLHFTLHGNKTHPVILFLHGFLGAGEDFEEVVSNLSPQFCCLCADLPGHGKTQTTGGDYTMPDTAQGLVDLLDRLKISQAHLVGYSMGGRLALYLALNFPDRFPKTILESASPGLKTEQERFARRQHDAKLADCLESDFTTFLREWYEQPLFQSLKQHPNFEKWYQQRLQNNPVELARSLRSLSTGEQPSLWDKLKLHKNLLLLVVGERDRKFVTINQEMVTLCSTAQLKIVRNVGHTLHLEDSPTFTLLISDFLNTTQ